MLLDRKHGSRCSTQTTDSRKIDVQTESSLLYLRFESVPFLFRHQLLPFQARRGGILLQQASTHTEHANHSGAATDLMLEVRPTCHDIYKGYRDLGGAVSGPGGACRPPCGCQVQFT